MIGSRRNQPSCRAARSEGAVGCGAMLAWHKPVCRYRRDFNPLPPPEPAAEDAVEPRGDGKVRRRNIKRHALTAEIAVNQKPYRRCGLSVRLDLWIFATYRVLNVCRRSAPHLMSKRWLPRPPSALRVVPMYAHTTSGWGS